MKWLDAWLKKFIKEKPVPKYLGGKKEVRCVWDLENEG